MRLVRGGGAHRGRKFPRARALISGTAGAEIANPLTPSAKAEISGTAGAVIKSVAKAIISGSAGASMAARCQAIISGSAGAALKEAPGGYAWLRRIIVPAESVRGGANLTNFPLCLALSGEWLKWKAVSPTGRIQNSQGWDIVFESEAGVRLDHDLETYDRTNGKLVAWVRVPVLSASAPTRIIMRYGADVEAPSERRAGVWQDYLAVWHLPDPSDRTGNDRDLTLSGVGLGSLIGQAGLFDGVDDRAVGAAAPWTGGRNAFAVHTFHRSDIAPITATLFSVREGDETGGFGCSIAYINPGDAGVIGGIACHHRIAGGQLVLFDAPASSQSTGPQRLGYEWQSGTAGTLDLNEQRITPANAVPRTGSTDWYSGKPVIGQAKAAGTPARPWDGTIDIVRIAGKVFGQGRNHTEAANWLSELGLLIDDPPPPPPPGDYALGPNYSDRWAFQVANPSQGTITQEPNGVILKAGASVSVTDGDAFIWARKAPATAAWKFSFRYTWLDGFTTTTPGGCFSRFSFIKGDGTGGIEANPSQWSAADWGDLSDARISANCSVGCRFSFNTFNSDQPENDNQVRCRKYDGAGGATLIPFTGSGTFTVKLGVEYLIEITKSGNTITWRKTAAGETTDTVSFTDPVYSSLTGGWFAIAAVNGRRCRVAAAELSTELDTPVLPLLRAATAPWLLGVNVAGAEFGEDHVPGTRETDYTWPTLAEVDYYAGKGLKILRLPLLFQRALQSADMALLKAIVDRAALKGMYVIIDPHHYARLPALGGVLATDPAIKAQITTYWGQLAEALKSKSNIVWGLMNEPNGLSASAWVAIANEWIASIRSTGSEHMILVPGTLWTGAHSWVSSGNSTAILNIVDSKNNWAVEVHQYFDSDFSGTNRDAVLGSGSTTLNAVISWGRTNGIRVFVGEFGAATPEGDVEVEAFLDKMDANRDVIIGATWWAGGGWWAADYFPLIEPYPLSGPDRAQMTILRAHRT
jgi:endoglucanase